MRYLTGFILFFTLLTVLAGCSRSTQSDPVKKQPEKTIKKEIKSNKKEFTIGVLYWSMNIPGQVAMRKGLEAAAKKVNQDAEKTGKPTLKLIPNVAGDEQQGIERQIKQMKKMIAQKVDLIIAQPTDIAALGEELKRANKAGIPVIAYDQHIIGGKLTAYITSNNYQAGYLDGEYVAANFPDKQKLKIVLIEYPHVSSTVERVDGFIDALEHYKQPYTIKKTYRAVEPISGKAAGKQFLKDFPEKGSIDVIFAINDGGGLAVVEALKKADRTEIFFASIDGDPASVNHIKSGTLTRIDSAQFCGEMGAESLRTAYRVLQGEKVAPKILIPVFPITRETVKQYQGWDAPIPAPFKKPWYSDQPMWQGKIISTDK